MIVTISSRNVIAIPRVDDILRFIVDASTIFSYDKAVDPDIWLSITDYIRGLVKSLYIYYIVCIFTKFVVVMYGLQAIDPVRVVSVLSCLMDFVNFILDPCYFNAINYVTM